MPNFTELSFANAVKFYKNSATPGVHLDDDFAVNQIKGFERRVCYKQKWQVGDETPLQCVSTVEPSPVVVYTGEGKATATTFAWTLKGSGGTLGVNLYECTISLDGVPNNRNYYLYFEANLLSYSAKFVSEPISVKTFHPNTLIFSYRNSINDFGTYFSTGIIFNFRCEAGLMDYQPESEGADYVDQIRDITILNAIPYDTFKLYIGEAPGVPNYIIKILNYIFACDYVRISRVLSIPGILFVKPVGEKWDATRVKGYPMFGWSTTIHPAINASSLQYSDETEIMPGFITAYNIDTNLFSTEPVEVVHITHKQPF